MFRSLYTAASGMEAQEMSLDTVANNLSNANTSGFRSRKLQFEDLLYQNMVTPGAPNTQQTIFPAGLQVGLGARSAATEVIQQQGNFSATGNPLDLAIQGSGFFQVLLPSGEIAYTRAGNFTVDNVGNLVTADGNAVQPAVNIPPDALTITVGNDGTVSVTEPGQQQPAQVGTIQLATFQNPGGLNSIGGNLFEATGASGDPIVGAPGGAEGLGTIQLATFQNPGGLNSIGGNLFEATGASGDPIVGAPGGAEGLGTIQQGTLEESNVNVVEEFVNLILAQRSYEANSRVVRAADEMFQTLNGLTT